MTLRQGATTQADANDETGGRASPEGTVNLTARGREWIRRYSPRAVLPTLTGRPQAESFRQTRREQLRESAGCDEVCSNEMGRFSPSDQRAAGSEYLGFP